MFKKSGKDILIEGRQIMEIIRVSRTPITECPTEGVPNFRILLYESF